MFTNSWGRCARQQLLSCSTMCLSTGLQAPTINSSYFPLRFPLTFSHKLQYIESIVIVNHFKLRVWWKYPFWGPLSSKTICSAGEKLPPYLLDIHRIRKKYINQANICTRRGLKNCENQLFKPFSKNLLTINWINLITNL